MKCKKAKWLSEEALHIAEERRETKSNGERERYMQLNTELQKTARRNKAFFNEKGSKQKKTTEWERVEISPRKPEMLKEHFMQGWVQ